MSWQYLPTLLVPVHDDDREFVENLVNEVTVAGLPGLLRMAENSQKDTVLAALKDLEEAGLEVEMPGAGAGEDYYIRVLSFCVCGAVNPMDEFDDLRSILDSSKRPHAGLITVARHEISDEVEKGAVAFCNSGRWSAMLLEEKNANNVIISSDAIFDTIQNVTDLIIHPENYYDDQVQILIGNVPGKKVFRGAVARDLGGNVLGSFKTGVSGVALPKVLRYFAKTGGGLRKEDAQQIADNISTYSIEQMTSDLLTFEEPEFLTPPVFELNSLQFFSSSSQKKSQLEQLVREFSAKKYEYADSSFTSGQRSSRMHRDGLPRVLDWCPSLLQYIVSETIRNEPINVLWPLSLKRIIEQFNSPGGRFLDAVTRWIKNKKGFLSQKTKSKPDWTPWDRNRIPGLDLFIHPNWWFTLIPVSILIALGGLYFKRDYDPVFLKSGLAVILLCLLLLGGLSFVFIKSKEKIYEKFKRGLEEVKKFFQINTHMQYLNLIEEAAKRLNNYIGGVNSKLDQMIAHLIQESGAKGDDLDLMSHPVVKDLIESFGRSEVEKVIDQANLFPSDENIEEIAVYIAGKIKPNMVNGFIDEPKEFISWIKNEVDSFFWYKRGLNSIDVLRGTGFIEKIIEELKAGIGDGEYLPYYKKGTDFPRGILFFPDGIDEEMLDLSRYLQKQSNAQFSLLPLHGRGRFGVLNLYEVKCENQH